MSLQWEFDRFLDESHLQLHLSPCQLRTSILDLKSPIIKNIPYPKFLKHKAVIESERLRNVADNERYE